MDLTQLRYLVTIADEGSFTQAARKLHLSQPSLSLAIKKLEEEVGQPLFDRLTRRVVPTEAGDRILETARQVLSELERARGEVRDLKGAVTGTLRVGSIPTIGPFLLPDILQSYHRAFPDVTLQITEDVTTRLLTLMEEGKIDAALISTIPERPGIHTEFLGNEELVAIISCDSPLAGKSEIQWHQLENQPFLVLGEEHCLSEQVSWFCHKNRLAGQTLLEGTQLATIAALVERGLGVSLVPALMVSGSSNRCCYRPLAQTPPIRPLYLAWSLLRYRTKACREFTRMARELIEKKLEQVPIR